MVEGPGGVGGGKVAVPPHLRRLRRPASRRCTPDARTAASLLACRRGVRPHGRREQRRCARLHRPASFCWDTAAMLLHLRLTVPSELSDDVVELLAHENRSANLTLSPGASLSPPGDLVECDVARELAGEIIGRLKRLGLHESGGILVTTPTSTPFDAARRLERAAPGGPRRRRRLGRGHRAVLRREPADGLLLPVLRAGQPARGDRRDHRLGRPGGRRDGRRSGVRHGRRRRDGPGVRPVRAQRQGPAAARLRAWWCRSWWSPC